jgi:hypothetical protein
MALDFKSPKNPPNTKDRSDESYRIALREKQGLIQRKRSESDCLSTFNILTNDLLFDEVERLLAPHRERLFPPTETLAMFVTQAMSADRSCQHIVNQAAVQRVVTGLPSCSSHTGGYCKARQCLPAAMVSDLTRFVGRQIDHQVPNKWRWCKRRVRLVDSATVTMPDTPSNQSAYPQQGNQKPGLGFPICRVVGITCLPSCALLNTAVGRFNGKGGDEQTLLRSMEQTLEKGDILLGDAFFPTFIFIASMQRQGVDIVMEQLGARKRSSDFRRGTRLSQRDHLVVIAKPKKRPYWMSEQRYQKALESITVREFKAGGKIMVTTMICAKTASKESLKSLYKQRWSVELDIRHIKETIGMNVLSCKTPEMAIKEIWVHLLAYNLLWFNRPLNGCQAKGNELQALSAGLADMEPSSRYIE